MFASKSTVVLFWSVTKGWETAQHIVRTGLREASRIGLTHVTIGGLAAALNMSKSGLFAHFGSKEKLQLAIVDFAAQDFRQTVVKPALAEPAGVPRICALVERWMGWDGEAEYALPGGCIFVAAATELDDSPDSPVRTRLIAYYSDYQDTVCRIHRAAVDAGHLADTDDSAFAHELFALMLGYHFASRMMRNSDATSHTWCAVDRLLTSLRR